MELGYRESTESWAAVMRGLADRGMKAPLLAVGDGAPGSVGRHPGGLPRHRPSGGAGTTRRST